MSWFVVQEELIVNMARLSWRKSSRSSSKLNCVEIAFADQAVLARDSKCRDAGSLAFSPTAWGEFVGGLRAGRFSR